jgi:hypothetical protein
MFKRVLVEPLISEGNQLLESLKRSRFPVKAAVWHYDRDAEEWRLIVVSPSVDRTGPLAAYTRIQAALARTSPSRLELSDIVAIGPASAAYRSLRESLGTFGSGPIFGDAANRTVEDGYVYQV